MHRALVLLALLPTACAPALLAPTADAAPAPAGAMKLDLSCFGGVEQEKASVRNGGPAPLYPSPTAAPAGGGSSSGRARPSRAPAPPASVMPMDAGAMDDGLYAMEESVAMSPTPPPLKKSKDEGRYAPEPEPSPVKQASFDWGGSTWLSNDDSMSLASAQRLLWAVANGQSWTSAQVRPHELLNYFSFDTETPKAGETFDVTASAEQTEDGLSVAFAVQGATPPRQLLDLTLVVDRSCSMEDEGRMDFTKRGLTKMTDSLVPGDRVDIVLFDDQVCTPLENWVAGRDDERVLHDVIARMRPEGGTDVDLGLKEGYAVATRKVNTHKRNRRVMAITDALMNTGDIDPNTVSEIGRRADSEGIRLTGVGVGWEFNDEVLDKLTEKGKGAYVFLGSEAVVDRVFGAGFESLVQTVAHDVRFRMDLPPSLALKRFYGEEASTVKEDVQAIHYFAGTSQVFLQDLAVADSGIDRAAPVKLHVEWRDAFTGEPASRTFKTTVGAMLDADPHNVRKARALMAWSDVLATEAMGGDACGAPLHTYGERAALVGEDAEIAYVDSLVGKTCRGYARPDEPRATLASVGLKVKVDSDIPIAEVEAACADGRQTDGLSPADTVARFQVAPGTCRLTLSGAVPMTADIRVAETGADVRCLVRGGRLSCT